jgi:DNA repair photolyase
MPNGLFFPLQAQEVPSSRNEPEWVEYRRRGPILRQALGSDSESGVFGFDLTAGCAHRCPFCHIQASRWYPGADRILFDPSVSRRLGWILDALDRPPRLVVLSPTSDPFPPHRQARAEAQRVVRVLLERGIDVLLMTRGRIPLALIGLLAEHRGRVRVAVGLTTLDRQLSRVLEPRAAVPGVRLRRIARLIAAEVPVEVRLEPLIPGLSDTREHIQPLFRKLTGIGVTKVMAHYLFLHPAMIGPLRTALAPLGLGEKLEDDYQGGPVFPLGSVGTTKHLSRETRQAGFARLSAWGAEHGLTVSTGATQNPDLPRGTTWQIPRDSTGGPVGRAEPEPADARR